MRYFHLATLSLVVAACGPSQGSHEGLTAGATQGHEAAEWSPSAELLPVTSVEGNLELRYAGQWSPHPESEIVPPTDPAPPSLEERANSWTLSDSHRAALRQEIHGPLHLEGYLGKADATEAEIRDYHRGRGALDLFRLANRAQKAIQAKPNGVKVFMMGQPLDREAMVPVLKEVRVLREMQAEAMASGERSLGMPTPERLWDAHYLNLDRVDTDFAFQRVWQAYTNEQARLGRNFMI